MACGKYRKVYKYNNYNICIVPILFRPVYVYKRKKVATLLHELIIKQL